VEVGSGMVLPQSRVLSDGRIASLISSLQKKKHNPAFAQSPFTATYLGGQISNKIEGFTNKRGNDMFQKILLAVLSVSALVSGQVAKADDPVSGYTRSNGTYVAPYYRTHPDHNFYNNYSTYPNINPYTGQMGTRLTPPSSSRPTLPSYSYPKPYGFHGNNWTK
jgi:hypothetical protein